MPARPANRAPAMSSAATPSANRSGRFRNENTTIAARPTTRIGAIALVLGIAVAITLSGRRNGRNVPLKVIARALFPRRLIRSASGKADIGFFLFNVLLGPTLFGWAIFTSVTVEESVRSVLINTLG